MEQSDNQTEQPSFPNRSLRRRFQDLLFGHRSKQFFTDPRTWFEVAALAVLCVYTAFTGQTLREIKNANRIDQRAWLTFSRFVLSEELKEGSNFYITGTIINTGKTPAIEATTTIEAFFFRPTVTPNPEKPKRADITNLFFVAPNTTPEFSTIDSVPSAEQMSAYRKTGFLFVKQIVWYQDIFGTSHWTTTCRWHQYGRPCSEFGFCSWGNAIDHNEP